MKIYRLTQTSVDTQNNYSEWETRGEYFSRLVDAVSTMTRDYQNITEDRMPWKEYAQAKLGFHHKDTKLFSYNQIIYNK